MAEVVPIGTPLLAGPATITTLLLLSDEYGFVPTFAGLVANLMVAWLVLWQASAVGRFLGRGGIRAVSKIMYLLLASIAVRMIVGGAQAVFGIEG
jgi:multiple antibiotic resistance protein